MTQRAAGVDGGPEVSQEFFSSLRSPGLTPNIMGHTIHRQMQKKAKHNFLHRTSLPIFVRYRKFAHRCQSTYPSVVFDVIFSWHQSCKKGGGKKIFSPFLGSMKASE